MASFYNTEGYKQDLVLTITNANDHVDASMVWLVNLPSYYSPALFQTDSYCIINGAQLTCLVDPSTPYQLILKDSPVTVTAGVAYQLTIMGLASPRKIYTNDAYPQRYIFVGVLLDSTSTSYV